MRSRDTDIVIVPGLGNSGPDHWQSRWQARLPNARRVEQADWAVTDRRDWIAATIAAVARCDRPVVVIAHSLGVIATVAAAGEGLPPIAGAFLVAPPGEASIEAVTGIDPAFAPIPRARLAFPSIVVGSHDDSYASMAETTSLAEAWGSAFIDAGDAGHINTASGHGPWPEGLMAFAGFLSKLAAPGDAQRA